MPQYRKLFLLLLAVLFLDACSAPPQARSERLQVLATTTIVGDVVARIGGDYIDLIILLPAGSDPHTFSVRPQDAAAIADADVIFANGAGLETFLPALLEGSGSASRLVEVSLGVDLLGMSAEHPGETDPHTWMDPNNVILWSQNIAAALAAADPLHANQYQGNAAAYIADLQGLDDWIRSEVELLPAEHRLLVEDHASLGYFARQYDFSQSGSITGSFSSESAPAAQELAALEDAIRSDGIRAIFLTEESNRTIVEQVGSDTGIPVIWLQVASLSASDGPAASYLELMTYNVRSIISGLK